MLFSSITFIYYFLPATLLIYGITPRRFKNFTLLVASLVFYAWGEPRLSLLMVATVFCGYILGLLTQRFRKYGKFFLTLSVVLSLSFLGYFKYADFFIDSFNRVTGLGVPLLSVTLPIGISFYTFQLLSYNIDVYRGDVPAQKNFVNLAAYIAMFPQLIAGPIVRYSDVASQLGNRTHTWEKTALGIRRFILGLGKKVIIANSLGELCEVFRESQDKSVLFCWVYAVAFSLHIYFDFSGYSDMAIGLGKILGFDFCENFNYPYISRSITEFWRRWHMSLGTWFRDYVYIPLGGSRVGKARLILNILVVWMLTGLWHGAAWNFVLWGLYFGILLIIEKLFLARLLEKSRVLSRIYVLLAVVISFVIFNASTLSQAMGDIGGMFGAGGLSFFGTEALYYLGSYAVILIVAIIGATPLPKLVVNKCRWMQYAEPVVLVVILVIVTAYLASGSFNPFLYFRF